MLRARITKITLFVTAALGIGIAAAAGCYQIAREASASHAPPAHAYRAAP